MLNNLRRGKDWRGGGAYNSIEGREACFWSKAAWCWPRVYSSGFVEEMLFLPILPLKTLRGLVLSSRRNWKNRPLSEMWTCCEQVSFERWWCTLEARWTAHVRWDPPVLSWSCLLGAPARLLRTHVCVPPLLSSPSVPVPAPAGSASCSNDEFACGACREMWSFLFGPPDLLRMRFSLIF